VRREATQKGVANRCHYASILLPLCHYFIAIAATTPPRCRLMPLPVADPQAMFK